MIVPAVRCMLGGTEELAGLTTGLDLSGNMTFTFYQVSARARCFEYVGRILLTSLAFWKLLIWTSCLSCLEIISNGP